MIHEIEETEGGVVDFAEVLSRIPHRYPMLLIDRAIGFKPHEAIIGVKNVTFNEAYFQGHFPDYPVMPGVLQVEAIAQAAGVMALGILRKEGKEADFDTILMSIDGAKFRRIVKPGDQLRIETTIVSHRRNIAKIAGLITVDGEVATEATLMFVLVPKSAREGSSANNKPKEETAQ